MTDAYKGISPETIEITSTHVYQRDKKELVEEKTHLENDILRIKTEIEKIDGMLGVLEAERVQL